MVTTLLFVYQNIKFIIVRKLRLEQVCLPKPSPSKRGINAWLMEYYALQAVQLGFGAKRFLGCCRAFVGEAGNLVGSLSGQRDRQN